MQNITFNFAKNPELKEVFARWTIGEEYEVTITFQLNEQDENEARGTIKKIEVNDQDPEETVVQPDASEPVMIVLAAPKSDMKSDAAMMAGDEDAEAYA